MKKGKVLLCIICVILLNISLITESTSIIPNPKEDTNEVRSSQPELPDKVFTFLTPTDFIEFNPLYLKKGYIYYIYIELVTPGNITNVKVQIWDPVGHLYEIFDSEMFFEPEYGKWFEIPFGTVLGGNYTLRFDTSSTINFNMLISISEGPKALHDKMDQNSINTIIFSQVTKFYNGMLILHNIQMKTDTNYIFHIGRISAISENLDNQHNLSYTIEDPDLASFVIYNRIVMESIDGINKFSFGTAQAGVYKIKIYIECDIPWTNIAYAVSEDAEISDVIPGNETIPVDNSTDILTNSTGLMEGAILAIGISVFGASGGICLYVIVQKKKNTVNIKNLGQKK